MNRTKRNIFFFGVLMALTLALLTACGDKPSDTPGAPPYEGPPFGSQYFGTYYGYIQGSYVELTVSSGAWTLEIDYEWDSQGTYTQTSETTASITRTAPTPVISVGTFALTLSSYPPYYATLYLTGGAYRGTYTMTKNN
jgi:hypothetical protein